MSDYSISPLDTAKVLERSPLQEIDFNTSEQFMKIGKFMDKSDEKKEELIVPENPKKFDPVPVVP